MALVIITWLWGEKYGPEDVRKVFGGFRRHLREVHRQVCVTYQDIEGVETTPIKDPGLTRWKGCLARLRLFDDVWQRDLGIQRNDRIVNVDLDVVVTGPLDILFDNVASFKILTGANASNPCPYNGSIFMLRGGEHADVWDDFTIERILRVPHHEFPDDQAWLAFKLPGAPGWRAGAESGIWAFRKRTWPAGDALPPGAKLVCFPGHRDPSQFTHLDWVKKHWI